MALTGNRNSRGGVALADYEVLYHKPLGFKKHIKLGHGSVEYLGGMFIMMFWSSWIEQCLSNLSRYENHLESLWKQVAGPHPEFLIE